MTNLQNIDSSWMRMALLEARKGVGKTSPNPAVGAVIVKDDMLLAKGHHRRAGSPHAEIDALKKLRDPDSARGATIYITLEPCSTHGRTPPCVDAILNRGIARAVIGAIDPNPAHAGRGVEILRGNGVEIVSGILEAECTQLNEAFNHWIVTNRPFVIAKTAMSLDGRITRSAQESPWLTSIPARKRVHRMRAEVDAILVGAETVRKDNPHLTVRGLGKRTAQRQPWRVILSKSGNLPVDSHVFNDEWKHRTLVFDDLESALVELGKRQITSLLIEGGGEILGAAFDQNLVDRIAFFYAPMVVGGDKSAVAGLGVDSNERGIILEQVCYEKVGRDLLCTARVKRD